MKKFWLSFLALATISLLATGCGGGGGGSDDDDTPVVQSGTTSSDGGSESTSPSVPEDFLFVQGATFDGTTAITDSEVFIEGRTVTIPSLLVCDHEVTQAEYLAVMGSNPSTCSSSPRSGEIQEKRPVDSVNWYDCLVYCNKRSIAEHLTPCYTINGTANPDEWGTIPSASDAIWNAATCNFSANGYRLPTEAEWEYLARAGNTSNSGQTIYSGSDTVGDVAWYRNHTGGWTGTHEVKKNAGNALGLYDMSGNVWEWCWDWRSSISASTSYSGASSGDKRIIRGGGWRNLVSYCAVSFRIGVDPSNSYETGGFRVVCSRSE